MKKKPRKKRSANGFNAFAAKFKRHADNLRKHGLMEDGQIKQPTSYRPGKKRGRRPKPGREISPDRLEHFLDENDTLEG